MRGKGGDADQAGQVSPPALGHPVRDEDAGGPGPFPDRRRPEDQLLLPAEPGQAHEPVPGPGQEPGGADHG
ncbi:hypothetical protein RZS08_37875, partial [Arthrospira platensis SPKY1]|nr:hypothetical protein [Arthrospira platensis SPKY1]